MADEKRCPICGEGVLRHLGTETAEASQDVDSPILETYTCGHEVAEPPLETADADRLEVERRSSPEAADPA
jgi:hypothetical protein